MREKKEGESDEGRKEKKMGKKEGDRRGIRVEKGDRKRMRKRENTVKMVKQRHKEFFN